MQLPFLEGNPLQYIFEHSLDHHLFGEGFFGVSKLAVTMWITCGLLILMGVLARKDGIVPRGKLRGLFEMIFFFIRDEIVYPTMGADHGRKFMPFFMTLFVFLFALNLLGMVPIPVIGGSVASTLGFTIPLALMILCVSIVAGLVVNGPLGFLKVFVPPGLPLPLVPVLFVLEFVGFFIKHGVLAIRLFANMIAGHLVVGALLGLIFMFQSYAMAVVSVPLALGVSFLELLVAFLQAYVFTLLSVLFIGGTVHPDH